MTVDEMREIVSSKLAEIKTCFKDEMMLTFIARHPTEQEREVVITDDKNLRELVGTIERTIQRENPN